MANFKPKIANPGDSIRSEDWNGMQTGLLDEITRLEAALAEMKTYVDSMTQTILIPNITSVDGKEYGLNDPVPGEVGTYQTSVLGLITKQWLPSRQGVAVICRFGLTDYFDELLYWAGAERGNQKALDVTLDYVDGGHESIKDVFIHERTKLAPKGADNPFSEFLLSPNGFVWYRYALKNPRPETEVTYITFTNSNPNCTTRIANVMHIRVKIRPPNRAG